MSASPKERRPAGETDSPGFNLFSGGPVYRIAFRLGLVDGESSLPRVGILIAALTWIPLFVLTIAREFIAGGVARAFAISVGTHVRFLVAIPLFFAVEAWAGPRLRSFAGNLVETHVVPPEEITALRAAENAAVRRRDSWIAEAALASLTIITFLSGIRTDVPGTASVWRMSGGDYTLAGWWYAIVAIPVFQFLFWRWTWRIVIWILFLRRVSKLKLQLIPTHPDLCGGLGYVAVAQTYISAISIAFAAVLSASVAEMILVGAMSPPPFLHLMLEVTGINLLIFLGPLLFFTMRMLEVKRRGYREYGILASRYTRTFDEKWVHGTNPPGDPLLGTSDIQSLADLSNGFNVIRDMRIFPFGIGIVANIMAFAIMPMLPLLLFEFSIDDIITKIAKLLLGM